MNDDLTPLTPGQTAKEEVIYREVYIIRVLIAFDIFVNVVLNGHEDETLSSHIGRSATEGKGWAIFLAKVLNKVLGPNHCVLAEAGDTGRAKDVIEFEEKTGNIE